MLKSAVAILLAAAAVPAVAAEYDVVTSFATAGSPFSFGSNFGANFVALTNYVADGCVGVSGLACFNTPGAAYTFPAVGKNVSASNPLHFYTNVLPTDMLFLQALPGSTATVRFTAPTAGRYAFTGSFTRIDSSDGSGDGVDVGTTLAGATYLPTVYGATAGGTLTATLAAGGTADFYVDALGNTYYDGTGLALTATAVPEPATWALFVAGFGLVGAAARRRVARAA